MKRESVETNVLEEVSEETVTENIVESNEAVACEGCEDTQEESGDMQSLMKELEENKNAYLRTAAEYRNFRKRTEKEKADIYKYANEKIFSDLLILKDSFERAIEMFDPERGVSFKEGIELIKKSLDDLFEKNDVFEIKAIGKEFDHNYHHAIMTAEVEGADPNMVVEVLQKGYIMNDKVIRPAMVKVTS